MPEKHRAIVMYRDEVEKNVHYEKQLSHQFGIDIHTCGSESLVMSFVRIPPGHRSRAHYHIKADLGQYFIKGRGKYYIGCGVQGEEYTYDLVPGTFIFIPKGVIHIIENTGDEDIESIACYGNVGSGEETGKFYCEGPLVEKRPAED
jgi:oxalate decarboxylase/phosphoglucose isomerase-like protein (cupin superfamily)